MQSKLDRTFHPNRYTLFPLQRSALTPALAAANQSKWETYTASYRQVGEQQLSSFFCRLSVTFACCGTGSDFELKVVVLVQRVSSHVQSGSTCANEWFGLGKATTAPQSVCGSNYDGFFSGLDRFSEVKIKRRSKWLYMFRIMGALLN